VYAASEVGDIEDMKAHFPVELQSSLIWGDMDAFGHLNNCMYFRLFETARIRYFEMVNFPSPDTASKIGPILASTTCEFRQVLTYPEGLITQAGVDHLGNKSLSMSYRILKESDRELAADGSAVIVLYDYAQRVSVPIPDDLRKRILVLEGSAH